MFDSEYCSTLFVDKSLETSEKLLMCPSEEKQTCNEVREKQQQMLSLDEFIKRTLSAIHVPECGLKHTSPLQFRVTDEGLSRDIHLSSKGPGDEKNVGR